MTQLRPDHLKMLSEESGISDEVIAARGYRTITESEIQALRRETEKSKRPRKRKNPARGFRGEGKGGHASAGRAKKRR